MTGFETMHLWLKKLELFKDKYVIGYWPWELPKWPEKYHLAYSLVDEVWASSLYTKEAYKDAPIPVNYMPMAVSVERLNKKLKRKDFKLPNKNFLFLFVFDFMSYPERKNPFAAIQSFISAFPKGNEKINLILKISNVQKKDPQWKKIKKLCNKDKRIIILDKTYSREQILALFNVCDAYVSLHRSEGFGRTMAEALLLEKPVIATNFSGNIDFINTKNAYPVSYQLIKLKKNQYPAWQQQQWADVNIMDAIKQFKAVYLAKNTKLKNQINIELSDKFKAQTCALKYSNRLHKITSYNI